MTFGKVELGGGFLLALALLYYMDRSGVFLWAVAACGLHELGHWWAIGLLGGGVRKMRLTLGGAEMLLSTAHPLSHGKMILAALAGPGMNLVMAALSARLARLGFGPGLYLFAGLHLGLAAFNLLPARWLDGGRALAALCELLWSREAGERAVRAGTAGTVLALLGAGAILLWHSGGRNFTLLLAGLWVGAMARRERVGQF